MASSAGMFGGVANDVMMGASNMAGQLAGSYAGISGMVAERGVPGGIPTGYYGGMAESFSRSATPPNIPPGRHKSRGLFSRSKSPGNRQSRSGQRQLPQLSLEAHDHEAEFLRRIDRFENELRRCAQQMAVESQRIEVVCRTTELIKNQCDKMENQVGKISSGLGNYVLKPIGEIQTALEGHYWYMNNVLDKRMTGLETETMKTQSALNTHEDKLNALHNIAIEVRTGLLQLIQQEQCNAGTCAGRSISSGQRSNAETDSHRRYHHLADDRGVCEASHELSPSYKSRTWTFRGTRTAERSRDFGKWSLVH